MKTFGKITTAVAALSLFANGVFAQKFPSIIIKGSKFFYSNNGTQFFMKGVAYQQEYSTNSTSSSDGNGPNTSSGSDSGSNNYKDPLVDGAACKRDIPYLNQLGTNTIRVYAIDPKQNHDECMQALQNAGIYVVSDLSSPGESIVRNTPTWNDDLFARYTGVVDTLSKYPNTLGFFAGNEVSNNHTNTDASAFVKAAVRDMKAYIKKNVNRPIGVGYATNDDAAIRQDLASYFDCGSPEQAIDFWGYNIYSWCGDSSYSKSGYDVRTHEFAKYNVPVFFAEYGCNTIQPRKSTEVQALYGPQMSPVWSGGIVYMYFQEANNYGLVSVSGNSVSTLDDFNPLSSQIASINPTGPNSAQYNPTNTAAAACPSVNSAWQAASALPPTPNVQLCECMYNALTCVPNNVPTDQIGSLFGIVCGLGSSVCDGIAANATKGNYGAYGMCNPTQQLGWAMNVYYNQQGAARNGASACDFSGSAITQSATVPAGSCSALISQVGQNGQGTVTSAPTATGGSGGGSGGSGSSSSAGVPGFARSSTFGILEAGAYLLVAFVAGASMILL